MEKRQTVNASVLSVPRSLLDGQFHAVFRKVTLTLTLHHAHQISCESDQLSCHLIFLCL